MHARHGGHHHWHHRMRPGDKAAPYIFFLLVAFMIVKLGPLSARYNKNAVLVIILSPLWRYCFNTALAWAALLLHPHPYSYSAAAAHTCSPACCAHEAWRRATSSIAARSSTARLRLPDP